MTMDFIDELKWRGLLHDMTPGTEEHLRNGVATGYIGFDPTSDSLHIGSLSQILTLMRFQKAGHRPIALIGGATGMIGDPSGKSAERNLLDEETLKKNVAGMQAQLERFLDFSDPDNGAVLVNNYDWMKNYSFIDFAREIGKHLTVNYMMAKDSVKNRLETGMSFTEFSYQLLQANDFLYLNDHYNCTIQMGGSDQWGNITSGTELIRRKSGKDVFAATTQLIRKADGGKFGKTESGNIWLDRRKTSPFRFYQFWINTTDEDAEKYIRYFTFLTKEEVDRILTDHQIARDKRLLQKKLAEEITRLVHGDAELQQAIESSELLFKGNLNDLLSIDEETFDDIFDGVPKFSLSMNELENGTGVVDLLAVKTTVFSSKGEARKMIQGGGVSINKQKVAAHDAVINTASLIRDKYIIIQKGKKEYYLCKAQ